MLSKLPISYGVPHLRLTYRYFDDAMRFHENLNLFDIDFWQISHGKFHGNLIEVVSDNVQIDRHLYNVLLKIEGTPTNNWAFGIPPSTLLLLFDQKYLLDDNYILSSPPQSSFKMIQKSVYGLDVIYFKEELLANICEHNNLPEPRQFLGDGYHRPSAVKCSSEQLVSLRLYISQFYQNLLLIASQTKKYSSSSLIYKQFIKQIEWKIPEKLVLILAEAQKIKPKKVLVKRTSILNQAEEFMKTYSKADITTQDISQEIGVSKRTLEYLFKEFYGISPKAYLKRLRLNQFRQALKSQIADGVKINTIAEEWGFWHSGQLAADYYQLFGELPSQTAKL